MKRIQLNEIYNKLDNKAREISQSLKCDFAYYNGHYSKNTKGDFEKDYFPIPVISVQGLCDIEIDLEQISVTTKLTKDAVLAYDFEKLRGYRFEAYGVENYLDDFYIAGDTISEMKEKVKQSSEENVFFSFIFSFEVESDAVCKFVNFISVEGFFY